MGRHSKFVADVVSGDRLRGLEALRLKLAQAMESTTDAKELAALSLRLERVMAAIAEMGGALPEEDDLAQRRIAKLSAAASS